MLPITFSRRLGGPLAAFDFEPLGNIEERFFGGNDRMAVNLDVREDDANYYVDVDVPGFSREDVDITFEGGLLTLSGERKSQNEREGENFHITERTVGSFSRSLRFGERVNETGIEAEMKNGVLTVRLAKADDLKPRKIEVKCS